MKADIHPTNYRPVIFDDQGAGVQFLIGSTIRTTETGTYDGTSYDRVVVEISSASHPFYTGKKVTIDRAGRVERFKTRASKAKK
jgi:large subunit ribosomal protein L31